MERLRWKFYKWFLNSLAASNCGPCYCSDFGFIEDEERDENRFQTMPVTQFCMPIHYARQHSKNHTTSEKRSTRREWLKPTTTPNPTQPSKCLPLPQYFATQNIIRIQRTKQVHIKPSLWIQQSTRHLINRNDTQHRRNIRLDQIIQWKSQRIKIPKTQLALLHKTRVKGEVLSVHE